MIWGPFDEYIVAVIPAKKESKMLSLVVIGKINP
jgi:hypothetical protein